MRLWKNIKGSIKEEYRYNQESLRMFWNNCGDNPKNDAISDAEYIMNAKRVLGGNFKYQQRRGFFVLSIGE